MLCNQCKNNQKWILCMPAIFHRFKPLQCFSFIQVTLIIMAVSLKQHVSPFKLKYKKKSHGVK